MAAEIKYTLPGQDNEDAARSQYWHRVKSPKRWGWLLGALAVIFSLFAYSDSCDLKSFLYNLVPYVLIILVICPLLSAICYFQVGRHSRKMFQQQRIKPDNRLTWNEDGLEIESDVGSLKARWSDFYGWRSAGRAYFIHLNEALYYLIPAHALSAEEAIDLEDTLARHGVVRR